MTPQPSPPPTSNRLPSLQMASNLGDGDEPFWVYLALTAVIMLPTLVLILILSAKGLLH